MILIPSLFAFLVYFSAILEYFEHSYDRSPTSSKQHFSSGKDTLVSFPEGQIIELNSFRIKFENSRIKFFQNFIR